MTTQTKIFRALLVPILVSCLCLTLTGCSLLHSGPPTAVVEKAVAQKLVQTQELLRSQLATADKPPSPVAIGNVTVSSTHKVTLDTQPAIAVEGTYTLTGGNLNRAQRRQSRPFEIYLRQGAEKGQWQLLEPGSSQGATVQGWRAIPLNS